MKSEMRIRLSLKQKDEVFQPGPVLAHLPLPCLCPQQQEIEIETVTPITNQIEDETSFVRTVAWEKDLSENETFTVTFRVVHEASYVDLNKVPSRSSKLLNQPRPQDCLGQVPPHLVNSPMIKAFAEKITKEFDQDFDKARAIYDYITKHMQYSYMPAYFSIRDIVEYALKNRRGDCGVFALTMISLCRAVGIPAYWQSGLAVEPNFTGAHDWLWFYSKDFGWLPADPSYGVSCHRDHLEDQRQFYFGNLDGYRIVFNQSYQSEFSPVKNYFRADPYDNQVGEMETTRGLNYKEYERSRKLLSFKVLDGEE